jgi:hypothetical protein
MMQPHAWTALGLLQGYIVGSVLMCLFLIVSSLADPVRSDRPVVKVKRSIRFANMIESWITQIKDWPLADELAHRRRLAGENFKDANRISDNVDTNSWGFEEPNGELVRRRISWYLNQRKAVAICPGETTASRFGWLDLPRPRTVAPDSHILGGIRDFEPGENRVQLIWDSIDLEEFLNEVGPKLYIIRVVYDIKNYELIPSELLYEAGLVYETGDWVDEWGCNDHNNEIIECPREIYPPASRKIRFSDEPLPDEVWQPNHDARYKPQRVLLSSNRPTGRNRKRHGSVKILPVCAVNARVEVEIPDSECFYTFKAGGFYEKGQKPTENACKEEEKAV